jgi:hypothetical protein
MIVFLVFSYFASALVCTAIALALYFFLRNTRHAKSILSALLVVSWALIDVYAWHSVGITQLLSALLFNQKNWLGPTSPWSYLISLTCTVIVARFAACRIHLKSKTTFQGSTG